jgi:P22 coat protein - gene protein 5
MPNSFSKEEKVAFEQLLEGFNDALVMSRNVSVYNYNQTDAARTTLFPSSVSPNYGTVWRPMPYIMTSATTTPGTPITISNKTQLTVPASITNLKTSAWGMNSVELRDALQEGRLAQGANQKLASDINVAVMDAATSLGSLVVTTGTPAGSFDDIALCDSLMNETGVPGDMRYLSLSSRSYNGLAGNVVGTTRSFGANNRSDKAFERAYVGMVSSFETYKQDYALRKTAYAGGAITVNTLDAGGNVNFVPAATTTSVAGVMNVDNRFQTITLSSNVGVAAGDAFTIDGIEAVHLITKRPTGQPKTFRVVSVGAANTVVITPPIISADSAPVESELQYKNCERAGVGLAAAAITFLNTTTADYNCFWHKSAIELLPGRLAIPENAGVAVMRASTDQGIEVVMQKQFNLLSSLTEYRVDVLFGTAVLNPEMCGVLLFDQ